MSVQQTTVIHGDAGFPVEPVNVPRKTSVRSPVPGPAFPPVVIPDGEPPAAAAALLAAVAPFAVPALQGRLEGLGKELDALVESARLDTSYELPDFLRSGARTLGLLETLRARLRLLAPTLDVPGSQPVATELYALMRTVRRWRPKAELKAERGRIIARIRWEIGQVDRELQSLADITRDDGQYSPARYTAEYQAGLTHPHDEFIRRCEALLKTRQDLRGRLARLDPDGDAGRSHAVGEALALAGGDEAVVAGLAPLMAAPSAAEHARTGRGLAELARQIAGIDPETDRATALQRQHDGLKGRLAELAAAVEAERADEARSLVANARKGTLEAVRALEDVVRGIRPELAEALGTIRGDGDCLIAVVAELIAPERK